MKTSLILCTKNGGERLRKCLSHIDRMSGPDDLELILVDNGSDDGKSIDILKDFAASSRFRSEFLTALAPGNSAGRNAGVERARGDLLLFIDDDCYAEPDFALQWRSVFARPDVGFGSGMIRRYDHAYSGLGCNESPVEELVGPREFFRRGFVQGSNMAFRATCLSGAGPFDPRFGAGTPLAGEEWELAIRASFAGYRGGYFPGPVVWHDHRRGDDETIQRMSYYDYGAGAVYAKHLLSRHGLRALKEMVRDIGARGRSRKLQILRGAADFYLKYMSEVAR